MAGETLHEGRTVLSRDILDRHRALSTIMEELEAIDWCAQRITASGNAQPLRRADPDAVDRGAEDPDTTPVRRAARAIAIADDRAIFHG